MLWAHGRRPAWITHILDTSPFPPAFGLQGGDPFYSRRNAAAAWTIQRAFRCYRARKVTHLARLETPPRPYQISLPGTPTSPLLPLRKVTHLARLEGPSLPLAASHALSHVTTRVPHTHTHTHTHAHPNTHTHTRTHTPTHTHTHTHTHAHVYTHTPGHGASAVRGVGAHPCPARLAPGALDGHQHHV